MPSERLLRASELPPGSRMFPRQGSALTGQEIGEAIVRVVTRMLEADGASEGEIALTINGLDEQMARGWWRAPHLTFPRAEIHFEVGTSHFGPWAFVAVELGVQGSSSSLVKLCVGNWPPGPPARQLKLGPSRIPDQMREELGLPLTAHFRLPDGSVVLAELADPTAEEVGETKGWFKGPNYHAPEVKSAEPAPLPPVKPVDLVGTPASTQVVPPAPKVEAKPAPKLVAGKGGRK